MNKIKRRKPLEIFYFVNKEKMFYFIEKKKQL